MSRVVVLATGQEGLCFPSGPSARVVVNEGCALLPVAGADGHPAAGRLCQLLTTLGIRPTTVDTMQQADCFVLVILADIGDGENLEALRHRLVEKGREAGLVLRIQREDVFRAMHRI